MEQDFPFKERIFILKGDQTLGPFDIGEVLEKLEQGVFRYDDVCLREGADETERLRQILDWDEPDEVDSTTAASKEKFDREDSLPTEGQDEILSPIERSDMTLYHGHRSMLVFPLAFCGLVGGVIAAVWLYSADPAYTFVGVAIAILSLGYLSLMRYTREYFISERRVELVTGLIARSSKEVRISDIRAVNVTCEGFSGMIGVGTVDFFTIGDNPEVSFQQAWAAREVKALVRKLQDKKG